MEHAATSMEGLAFWVKLTFEAASILIVVFGGLVGLRALVLEYSDPKWLDIVRSKISRYLLLALDIQMAADIVGTAIAPSWEQLGKLAAIAAIRTFLSYFLVAELREDDAAISKDTAS